MKILVMTDMEGVAGMINRDDWVIPEGRYYDRGRALLTEETNAAVDGLFAGGASEVLVVDGHGAGGIDPELLDERAQLMRGATSPVWPWGLDKSFHGLAFVGQHAKAGTPYSHLTHTQNYNYIDLTVNGLSIGEYGQVALCAMELGVPTIFAAGEEALAREAEMLTPGVVTVAVKRGLLPDRLEHVDTETYGRSKLSAIHLSPTRARDLIRGGALHAATLLGENPRAFSYPKLEAPFELVCSLRSNGDEPAREIRRQHPTSFIGLLNQQ